MRTIFLDFDDTIVNSTKAFCSSYNYLYHHSKDFEPADWKKTMKWNFSDVCPLLKSNRDVEEIFDEKLFFNLLEFNDEAKEVLRTLSKQHKLVICSIGKPINVALKSIWIADNLPFIHDVILIRNNSNEMCKKVVNMKGAIFVDDVASNLESSNASLKFCFGKVREVNQNWDGYRVHKWKEFEHLLSLEGKFLLD